MAFHPLTPPNRCANEAAIADAAEHEHSPDDSQAHPAALHGHGVMTANTPLETPWPFEDHGEHEQGGHQQELKADVRERMYVPEILKGIAITTKHFLRNLRPRTPIRRVGAQGVVDDFTINYPEERPNTQRATAASPPGAPGRRQPRCVACYMCATICPAQCIYIEAGEYSVDDASPSHHREIPKQFVIDELRRVAVRGRLPC